MLGRRRKEGGGGLVGEVLSANHNGREEGEVKRIMEEHPGESECVLRDRVLGAIAVTRGKNSDYWHLRSAGSILDF